MKHQQELREEPRFVAVVPAAGVGARMGAAVPKQYLEIAGRSILAWSVEALLAVPWIDTVLVVVAPGDARAEQALSHLLGDASRLRISAVGGASRRDSVLAGLRALQAASSRSQVPAAPDDWVLVHDAARPGLSAAVLERLRDALRDESVGGIVALPVADTVKRADSGDHVETTVSRAGLWMAQTPQMFRFSMLCEALERHPEVTDEAAAIEACGLPVRLVEGDRRNFKVTTTDDLAMMTDLLAGAASRSGGTDMTDAIRVGQGYDVHALVPGRRLVIGGVEIPHSHGLLGHSDADVLLHAITDALLGAAALGDIGRHFPDTDERFRGADSVELLREAAARVREAGFAIGNIDSTVIAQAPRLAPHVPAMVERIAEAVGIAPARVNVKGKTNERLGFEGRREGIVAQAVVVLTGVGSAR